MRLLARRIAEVQHVEPIKAVVLDALLPRQALVLEQISPPFLALLTALEAASQPLAVLGSKSSARLPGIEAKVMRFGVECHIERLVTHADGTGGAVLVGGRLCEVLSLGPESSAATGAAARLAEFGGAARYFDARVRWIDLAESDEYERAGSTGSRAVELAARELTALVAHWLGLVRAQNRERAPGQLAELLHELGPMPPLEQPSDRALWAAALLNPEPALGVALEVRPSVLGAPTALSRLQFAKAGLIDSIRRMKGGSPLFDA